MEEGGATQAAAGEATHEGEAAAAHGGAAAN